MVCPSGTTESLQMETTVCVGQNDYALFKDNKLYTL